MNIYVTDENPRVCAELLPEYNWAGRAMDAMELLAAGLEKWAGEECEIECHEPNASHVKWVTRDRRNWEWMIEYGYWLVRELGRRKEFVPMEYLAFLDYLIVQHGTKCRAWGCAPPVCLPKEYKFVDGKRSNVVNAYRQYVNNTSKMRGMGGRVPDWLEA